MDESDKELTRLLLNASIHHLQSTLETLPVGQIEVDRNGLIESVDRWAESALAFDRKELEGQSLERLLGEAAAGLLPSLRSRACGSAGKMRINTGTGATVSAAVVVAPAIERHRLIVNLIFTV